MNISKPPFQILKLKPDNDYSAPTWTVACCQVPRVTKNAKTRPQPPALTSHSRSGEGWTSRACKVGTGSKGPTPPFSLLPARLEVNCPPPGGLLSCPQNCAANSLLASGTYALLVSFNVTFSGAMLYLPLEAQSQISFGPGSCESVCTFVQVHVYM